ncbi:hypothetical protein ACFOKI_02930 [Sphingomonas qilianensis]|uniref:Uncharacterized protein n=1 Tax=Sphingomonas qilianensis TaxID=1736690 RepID=A0ABU9XVI8_9SPHN
MSALPDERTPRHRAMSQGSNQGQGEGPKPAYTRSADELNRRIDVYAHGQTPNFSDQGEVLNSIPRRQIKAVLVRDAEPSAEVTALGNNDLPGADIVILIRGSTPQAPVIEWTFYRFPTRHGTLVAADLLARKIGVQRIDDTTEGRASVPALAS